VGLTKETTWAVKSPIIMESVNRVVACGNQCSCKRYSVVKGILNYVSFLFIYLFYIPLIFTDVKLVIYIVSIVDKQVYIVVPYCNITDSIVDKVSIHKLS
jgi:hypothetical protein